MTKTETIGGVTIPTREELLKMYPPETTEFAFSYFKDDRKPDDVSIYIALMMVQDGVPSCVFQGRAKLGWRGEKLMSRVLNDLRREREIEDENILDEAEARALAEQLNLDLDAPKPAMLERFFETNGFRPLLVAENTNVLKRRDKARHQKRSILR